MGSKVQNIQVPDTRIKLKVDLNAVTESLRVLHKDIMFQFVDGQAVLVDGKIRQTAFQEKTDWGFVFKSPKASAENPRWGIVTHVGPEVVEDIKIGMKILIAPLKWTNEVQFNRTSYWKTNEEQVLAIED